MSDGHVLLQRDLSVRLGMQISISALKFVEEWMDTHLGRWLDFVPTPPELPSGHAANFLVRVGCGLERVKWVAYGEPSGFVPKLVAYFKKGNVGDADLTLLDQLGNLLQPELMGMWISCVDGAVQSGWQFNDSHSLDKIDESFAEHAAKKKIKEWLPEARVEKFRRFSQVVGEDVFSEIDFPLPAVSLDEQLSKLSDAIQFFVGKTLSPAELEILGRVTEPDFTVRLRVQNGEVTGAEISAPSLDDEQVEELCEHLGQPFDERIIAFRKALNVSMTERVMIRFTQGQKKEVDLVLAPGSGGKVTDVAERPN